MKRLVLVCLLFGLLDVASSHAQTSNNPTRVGLSRIFVDFNQTSYDNGVQQAKAVGGFTAIGGEVLETEYAGEQASRAIEALASCYDNPQYWADCKSSANVLAHFGVHVMPAPVPSN